MQRNSSRTGRGPSLSFPVAVPRCRESALSKHPASSNSRPVRKKASVLICGEHKQKNEQQERAMRRAGQFTSKLQAMQSAKRAHMCTACRHNQLQNWKDDPCPACGQSDTRQYFASRKELERAAFLLLQRDTGHIRNLRFQVRYDLVVNGVKVCTYVADAEYVDSKGRTVIEDTKPKGFTDKLAALKIALFEALYQPQTVTFYR